MSFPRDVAYSVRTLRQNPWFTLTALLSLTIGVGASTAIFALVNAILLRPLPGIREPHRLVNVHLRETGDAGFRSFSGPSLRDFQQADTAFSGLASFSDHAFSLARRGESQLVAGQIVSGNYFEVLGVKALRGRFFTPEEQREGSGQAVAVVSFTLWQRRLGGDPNLIGSRLVLNGLPLTIVGIAPRGFGGTFVGFVYDVWVPRGVAALLLHDPNLGLRKTRGLEVVGRLRPGVTLAQAQAGMSTIQRRLAQDFPEERHLSVVLSPMTGFDLELRAGVIVFLSILMVVSLLVLLIASMNVANLVLARGVTRRKEIAVRLALGAGRRRLLRQLLTESMLLALMGGLGGTLAAGWGVELLRRLQPPAGIPLVFDFTLDPGVLAFAFMVSGLSGVVFGLLPARQAWRTSLVSALKGIGLIGSGWRRLRGLLVIGQVAASTLLLLTAGLFLRALQRAGSLPPGFDPQGVEAVTLDPSVLGLDANMSRDLLLRLEERLAALPGVTAAAMANKTPLGFGSIFGGAGTVIQVEGRQPPPGVDGFKVDFTVIGPRYLGLLRIPLLRGRDFGAADRETSPPVAIVDETMARCFWPREDPVGKRFLHDGRPVEIVGLAKASRYVRVDETPREHLYLPFAQLPATRMTIFLRARAKPASLAPLIRDEIQRAAPNLPVLNLMTMNESMAIARLPQRVAAAVAASLGLTGLLLAAVGVYGVVAYSVRQRRREIGIRMALGADRASVIRLVLRQGVGLAVLGVMAGVLGALVLGRVLSGLLFGLSPADLVTFTGIPLLLLVTAGLASLLPAQDAARSEPTATLGAG